MTIDQIIESRLMHDARVIYLFMLDKNIICLLFKNRAPFIMSIIWSVIPEDIRKQMTRIVIHYWCRYLDPNPYVATTFLQPNNTHCLIIYTIKLRLVILYFMRKAKDIFLLLQEI